MRPTKLRAASEISLGHAIQEIIGKAQELKAGVKSLRILEDKPLQTAEGRYCLRAHIRQRP